MFTLRPYQQEASNAAVKAFKSGIGKNGILVLPTGSGKSLIIADIASKLDCSLLVFQPSKEILEQNFCKLKSYGINDCSIYSASVGIKEKDRITFATIGSVINKKREFRNYKYIIIDECHCVCSKCGMYKEFLDDVPGRVVIGLTATPYRLSSWNGSSMLKFLTRTRPRVFESVLYYCQVSDLLRKGYLADMKYYDITSLDMNNVRGNSTGSDYDDKSLIAEYERSGFYCNLLNTVRRLKNPKIGGKRRGILVFTRFVREAQMIADNFHDSAIVSGTTPKKEREIILSDFKAGNIEVVANVQTLTTGFDYPELDTILIARPTKSLALYYQMVGRCLRPSNGKNGWIVDMCGNIRRFGKVDDLRIECPVNSQRWAIMSNGRALTNVYF